MWRTSQLPRAEEAQLLMSVPAVLMVLTPSPPPARYRTSEESISRDHCEEQGFEGQGFARG